MSYATTRKCKRSNFTIAIILSALTLLALFAANLLWGAVEIPLGKVISILTGGEGEPGWRLIVLESRLPQAVTAMFAGMALSAAGLMLQTLFNNPLAGPEVFGINSGAGLGVAIVMLLLNGTLASGGLSFGGYAAILSGAFIGALAVIAILLLLSMWLRNNIYLLIAGLAVSYLTSSVITLLNYFSTAEGVHSYLIWGMGSFGGVSTAQLPLFATLLIVTLTASLLMVKPLNALLLGDAYAANLGVKTKSARGVLLALTGILTAGVTAFCGPIAFIGLAVPHIARLFLSTNNHIFLLPATILWGGATALLCNLLCQLPGSSGLLPLGAVTPIIGAPVILYVVIKRRGISAS
ncbi:MAG: iron ABC transporter permease [Bacteroidaceae bacterium]|nr:iron ABC transporter permease [Bacteroidaceae bacterium]